MVAVQLSDEALECEENSSNRVVVSPAMAADWLDRYRYPHNRPVSQWTVDRYVKQMQAGQFFDGSELVFVRYQGMRYLINGQHRLSAQVRAQHTISYVIINHQANSEEEIALRYGVQDTGKTRRFRDLAHSLGLCDELRMTITQIEAVVSAVQFFGHGLTGKIDPIPRQDLADLVRHYAPAARRFYNAIVGAPHVMSRAMTRQSTLSVALLSFTYVSDAASRLNAPSVDDFWKGVAIDDRISVTDPRKYASRHLMESTVRKTAATADRRFTRPSYSARYIIQCFNAYMERRELKGSPKVLDDAAPIAMWNLSVPQEQWLSFKS